MKHFTLLTNKRHILLVLIMMLCSLRVAYADDSGLVTQQITVNVPTAGTLSNIIQSDKMYKITNLKITGSLNADDIRFIRKMAGCYYNGSGSKYDGHLQYLDLGSLSQISYVHSFEVYDENGNRSTLNDCLFPLAYLYNLKTVVLPDLYKDYNFSLMGCRNLTTAKMPDNLEKIGNNTFKDCSSLVDISLSPTITSIGEYAFSGCSSLTEIQIPVNVTYIGQYAFYGCSSLKGINVPTDFVNISASTFENCANLQYFFNYNYIESIGDRAFAGCSKLSWIANLLLGTPSIGTYVFENCKSLKSVRVPENIKTLPLGMFFYCPLSSITLPQNLTSIDDNAFNGCDGLRDISIPSGVTSIGKGAFKGCSLKEFTLPKQVTEITDEMFCNCSLQHIYLHDGLKSIGNYAFANSALTEITIPNSVMYIGKNCFSGSYCLEEAVISSDYIAEIPKEAFADCNALNIIKLPANLERIGERAFIGTWRLGTKEGLTIPSKVREIGAEAFYKSLFDAVDIVLPASLTNIYSAFEGSGARVIHCYMPEPLPLSSFSFGGGGGSLSNCKLYVPKGCANKYRNAEVWRDFDIEEMEVTGIGSVTNDSTVTEEARYDANGQQLSVPKKGLNIVHYSDGTVKKIMVE